MIFSGPAIPKLANRTIAMIHSRLYLDFFIRDKFTDDTGFSEMYIMDECAKSFRVVYGLQKFSLFKEKFGTLINGFQVIQAQLVTVTPSGQGKSVTLSNCHCKQR